MITSIIFDLDGLLADTEALQMQAYQQVLLAYGVTITDAEYAQHWIRDGSGIVQFLINRQLSLAPDVLRRRKAEIYQALLETSLRPMPGANEVVERLSRSKRLAVASGSQRGNVVFVLSRLGLAPYIEVIVTTADVKQGKPAPDIFVYTARCLKVKPAECVVVEDAEKGILAAHRAGMQSIAIPNQLTRDNDFSAASCVAGSLFEIEALVENL